MLIGWVTGFDLAPLIVLLLLFAVEYLFADLHWLLTTLAWAPQYPWLLGALLLCLLSIAARAPKATVVSLATAAFAATALMGPSLGLGRHESAEPAIRVVTLNAGSGKAGPAALAGLERHDSEDRFEGYAIIEEDDLAVLSRLPIVDHTTHAMGFGTGRSVLEVRVQAEASQLTVLTTHFFRGRAPEVGGRLGRALADLPPPPRGRK